MTFTPKIIEFIENNFDTKLIENKNFLEAFKNVVTSELDLKCYLREIILTDLSKYKAVAAYYKESKIMYVDPNGVIKELELLNLDINSRTIIFQFFIALIHETSHVNQIYKFEKSKSFSTYEICLAHSELVKSGNIHLDLGANIRMDKTKGKRLYLENDRLFPIEREAEIGAWEVMLPIYERLRQENIREIEQLRNAYSDLLFEDYDLNNCPLEKFYNLIDRHDIFNTLDFSKYNVHERCLCGMPLTGAEYSEELEKSLTPLKKVEIFYLHLISYII